MQQRKRYSEEFKREAVGLTRLPGANVSQIARDLGIRANQLLNRPEFSRHLQAVHYGNHGGVYERQAVFG